MFKYVTKDPDKATIAIEKSNDSSSDEPEKKKLKIK